MAFQSSDPLAADAPDPAHVAAVLAGLAGSTARCGDVRVVAIDGRSGAGKTSLALAVAATLGAPVVHMEHLYPGWDGLAASVDLLVDRVLVPLARGEVAAYPVWDWHRGDWDGTVELHPAPVVVIEGCGASVGPAGEYAALRVWVEAPQSVRRGRGLARDGETYRPFWERWAAQEAAVFTADETRSGADLILRTG